jgi:hypothetical protein
MNHGPITPKPNWHQAKRALAGFASQTPNMPFTVRLGKQGTTHLVLSFDFCVALTLELSRGA